VVELKEYDEYGLASHIHQPPGHKPVGDSSLQGLEAHQRSIPHRFPERQTKISVSI